MPSFPQARLSAFHAIAARILETRPIEGVPDQLAAELLEAFYELCLDAGLDGLLDELAMTDDPTLVDQPAKRAALVAKLGTKSEFDPGGPRNAKPKQLVACVLSALDVAVVDEPPRPIELGDDVRKAVMASLAAVIDDELAAPKLRDAIVAHARSHVEERHRAAFEKITPHLDERAMKLTKQPKVPLDAMQAVQPLLASARLAVIDAALQKAFARALPLLPAEAAARLEQPITARLTPRAVAVRRAADPRTPKTTAAIGKTVFDAITELAQVAWRVPEEVARPYSASQTYAIGDVVEHPKFGRGKVVAVATSASRIDVEFADTKVTLVHAKK